MAHQSKRLIPEVRFSFVTEFLLDNLTDDHSKFQAPLRRDSVTWMPDTQTFIVTRTPSSQARLITVVQSHVHSLHLSCPTCRLIQAAQMSYLQGFHSLTRPYAVICVTILNIATRPFTTLRKRMLPLTGYPQCYHCGRLKEFLLLLRTNGSVLLPTTWFSRTTFPPRQWMGLIEPPTPNGNQ